MAELNRIIEMDQRNKACPKCKHGVLRINMHHYHRDEVKCNHCGHTDLRFVEFIDDSSSELPKDPSRYRKVMNFIIQNKIKMSLLAGFLLFLSVITYGAVKQHIYESPERAILQEMADHYNVPRPSLVVRNFERYHWRGEHRVRTIGYYHYGTVYILPCARQDYAEWLELVRHEFVHYYLDETGYNGPDHGPAFRRVMSDLGYSRDDISFNSSVCRPDHAT